MDKTRGWTLTIGILVILAFGIFYGINAIRDAIVQSAATVAQGPLTQAAEILNPTPTVLADPVAIIQDVRALSRLETVQYSIERVITADRGLGIFDTLFGDKLLFVAHGIVIAGTDLQKLGPNDMWVENGVLYVRLPEPEIFIATLDNEKSYVYDRETGLLTRGDINLETEARRVAEESIEDAALEDNILDTARTNAELYFSLLFRDLGYPDVVFVTE